MQETKLSFGRAMSIDDEGIVRVSSGKEILFLLPAQDVLSAKNLLDANGDLIAEKAIAAMRKAEAAQARSKGK